MQLIVEKLTPTEFYKMTGAKDKAWLKNCRKSEKQGYHWYLIDCLAMHVKPIAYYTNKDLPVERLEEIYLGMVKQR
jgi:hypothetical protein